MSTVDVPIQLQLLANYYLNLISFSLLYYEYFITINLEVSRYWGLKPTTPTVLFFLNRYGMLLGTVPVIVQYFWAAESTPQKLAICRVFHDYHQWFAVISQVIIGVMLIFRTYALYERNRRILGLMIFVAAGVIGVGAWAVVAGPTPKPGDEVAQLALYSGCSTGVSSSQAVGLAAAWAGMGVFDCTIFILTLYRALSRNRVRGLDLVAGATSRCLLLSVILLVNLSNILTFLVYSRGVLTTFANVISSVMITRLMFNLRDPSLSSMSGRRTRTGTSLTLTNANEGIFSTYLGSTAAPGLRTTVLINGDIELENPLYR
ncbi:hypothetical protein R3P38DRAFT_3103492 [Favolaschia claudopus]|uniref:DUF6533 domain-containing protein n=1 Tax=Favolaschia claudopus TaxID=2862362 RepID=A0AAV9ZL55_9AGAR